VRLLLIAHLSCYTNDCANSFQNEFVPLRHKLSTTSEPPSPLAVQSPAGGAGTTTVTPRAAAAACRVHLDYLDYLDSASWFRQRT